MAFTYSTDEKLKSQKLIDLLFSEGQSVSKYPLRLVYVAVAFEKNELLKVGVAVSKKHFKKAVDRNRHKRLLRECYRLNKKMVVDQLQESYAVMLFYQSKEPMSFQEMNEKTKQLFDKWLTVLNK